LGAGGEGLPVKRDEEIMEILEAFDITGSYRTPASWRAVITTRSPGMWCCGRPGMSPGSTGRGRSLAAALAKAQRIATRAPLSVEAAKSAITQAFELDFEQGQALQTTKFIEMFRTEDHQEALRAFFEKREGTYVRR
jgi:enoyl-CoA hydratase/carnithine racemase